MAQLSATYNNIVNSIPELKVDSDVKEIGERAVWTLSTAKVGNGIEVCNVIIIRVGTSKLSKLINKFNY